MRHTARKEIQREVTGLTADRIHELWVAAGGLEEQERPAVTTEDRLAAVRRSELKRLWSWMTAAGRETYAPEDDPAVDRWQQESEKRADGEAPGAGSGERLAGGAYQLEDARRRYLATILENALTTVRGRELDSPDEERLALLDDFFTRAVVFPDPHTNGVHPRPHQALFGWTGEQPGIGHASEPGRALAVFLLAFLDHHGMALTRAAAVPAPAGGRSGVGRPSVRDAENGEGGEASAELVGRVLAVCEQHFAAVTGSSSPQWEAESREVVEISLRTVKLAERDAYPQVLEEYLTANRARLERLWARYGPGGLFAEEVVLVDFPACYVLCERIETDPLWLEGVWAQHDQEATALERLHDAWLYDTRDKDGGR